MGQWLSARHRSIAMLNMQGRTIWPHCIVWYTRDDSSLHVDAIVRTALLRILLLIECRTRAAVRMSRCGLGHGRCISFVLLAPVKEGLAAAVGRLARGLVAGEHCLCGAPLPTYLSPRQAPWVLAPPKRSRRAQLRCRQPVCVLSVVYSVLVDAFPRSPFHLIPSPVLVAVVRRY